MEFTPEQVHGTINRSVEIHDGPVLPHPNSSTGKKIRVMYAAVQYTLERGEWVAKGWSAYQITGIVLKKDGTEGKETWGGTVAYDWEKRPEYDWLRKLAKAMQPEGSPALPFRLTGLENDDLEED